ncbi:MAG: hypothetical protein ACLP7A_03870 [Desulfobaccales bacterium]
MAANQLDQASYTKFFTDINNAMKEKSEKKVTLAMVLARNNVQLNLPPDIMAKIQPALDTDLNLPVETRKTPCAACAVCAVCSVCAEMNAASGLAGLVGTVGLT